MAAGLQEKILVDNEWRCEVCGVSTKHERQLDEHLKGRRHAKSLKLLLQKNSKSEVPDLKSDSKKPKSPTKTKTTTNANVLVVDVASKSSLESLSEDDISQNGTSKTAAICIDGSSDDPSDDAEMISGSPPLKPDAPPFIPLSSSAPAGRDSTDGDDEILAPQANLQGDRYTSRPPWLTKSPETLDEEVRKFVKYVSPTDTERRMRSDVVSRLKQLITGLWPKCSAEVFGSFATDLYLPNSDIDICVKWVKDPNALFVLAREIRKAHLCSYMNVIAKAKVPIIKMLDKESGCRVDICFGNINGPRNTQNASKLVKQYPLSRPMMLVVKYYIAQFGLNEVFTGGVGSYTLLLMIISFLQLREPKITKKKPSEVDLGVLLVEFFELYGRNFNYVNTGISVKGDGGYFHKYERGWYNPMQPFCLSIEDPDDPENDVSRSSYLILDVRAVMLNAYYALIADDESTPTALCRIILRDRKMEHTREKWARQFRRSKSDPHIISPSGTPVRKRSRSNKSSLSSSDGEPAEKMTMHKKPSTSPGSRRGRKAKSDR